MHVGRTLPCKCGRSVKIERPADGRVEAQRIIDPVQKKTHKARRRRSAQAPRTYAGNNRFERALHRTSAFAASTLRPLFHGKPTARIATVGSWGYLLAISIAWAALVFSSERSLPGTLLAYGPRWLALYPLVVLLPLSALFARPTLVLLAVATWICLVPVMGARISLSTLFASGFPVQPEPGTFRLLTFNADGGERLAIDLPEMLHDEAPDIVTFQECGDALWERLNSLVGWHSARHGGLCTGSRWPISAVDLMRRDDFAKISTEGFGGTALVMRTFIATPHGPLVLVNLHLETARKGLEGMLGNEGFIPDDPFAANRTRDQLPSYQPTSNSERFMRNSVIRRAESQRASHWITGVAKNAPLVVAGDFNMPVESTIYDDFWRQFTDAFEAKGNGLGWTKREGRWLRIRIDHVLTTDAGPKPIRIKIGSDYSSDHLPVVVDLRWPTGN
ncbi:MAG: endonuclease/exonuclease/phosphatase family protein [Gemmatimonadota bacterium]|nr:endonuclease/exonuclease/phosphatase family protein [Gemmatimonadota bacterium]